MIYLIINILHINFLYLFFIIYFAINFFYFFPIKFFDCISEKMLPKITKLCNKDILIKE